ncbi:hypothetical protein [Aliikangiella coralliicola]|uniref:Uncharacterized protein n=1 Tax=Aliikangiella coralliicola TaxID=2592383 RepID=A0A545UIH3_9GAMM|nr:hypothetical protein [Aliikangiella coralliicola]TQV89255.1 hypothetical protein FLL46_03755 [Aliikangiella coralliicola]
MNLYKILFATAIGCCQFSCSLTPAISNNKITHQSEEMAVLTDYQLKDGFITITAVSNGCTFFDSFRVEIEDTDENRLKIVRVKPDLCQMKRRAVDLQYSYKHLGLNPKKSVSVANKLDNSEG